MGEAVGCVSVREGGMPLAIPLVVSAMNAAAVVAVRTLRPVHPRSIVSPVLVDVEAVGQCLSYLATPLAEGSSFTLSSLAVTYLFGFVPLLRSWTRPSFRYELGHS